MDGRPPRACLKILEIGSEKKRYWCCGWHIRVPWTKNRAHSSGRACACKEPSTRANLNNYCVRSTVRKGAFLFSKPLPRHLSLNRSVSRRSSIVGYTLQGAWHSLASFRSRPTLIYVLSARDFVTVSWRLKPKIQGQSATR